MLNRWIKYRTAAGVDIEVHRLRHAHAMEVMDSGVTLDVIRRWLGHAKTETTRIYGQARDELADNEIRAARRRGDAGRRSFGDSIGRGLRVGSGWVRGRREPLFPGEPMEADEDRNPDYRGDHEPRRRTARYLDRGSGQHHPKRNNQSDHQVPH